MWEIYRDRTLSGLECAVGVTWRHCYYLYFVSRRIASSSCYRSSDPDTHPAVVMHPRQTNMGFISLSFSLSFFSQKGMRVLVDARDKLGVPWQNSENEKHGMFVMSFENKAGMPVEPCTFQLYVPALQALWNDSGIQEAYGRRSEFQLVSEITLHFMKTCAIWILFTGRATWLFGLLVTCVLIKQIIYYLPGVSALLKGTVVIVHR